MRHPEAESKGAGTSYNSTRQGRPRISGIIGGFRNGTDIAEFNEKKTAIRPTPPRRSGGFMTTPTKLLLAGLAAFALSASSASAFPIAVGGEGSMVLVVGSDPIIATYQGNSAAYSNDLYLERLADGTPGQDGNQSNDLFIFNNHTSPILSTANLGAFAIGTELIFRLHVNDTGYDYFSGPASRNPDSLPHVRVQGNWMPNETLVSFEDLYGLPEYPGGFNDLSFSFTNTSPTPSPEPMIVSILAAGLAGVAFVRRRRV
jgi:hypothetical protein